MELMLFLFAGLFGIILLFLLVEYPYYLISVFIFSHLYNFNIDLPGPLDLRGLLTISIFVRLIVFDKENLALILKQLVYNKIFWIVFIFGFIYIVVTYSITYKFLSTTRILIFNLIGLMIAFVVVMKGETKKVFFTAILMAGLLATSDLIYSYFTMGRLRIVRILDFISKTDFTTMNHNFFGMLTALAFVTTYSQFISKNLNKIASFLLFAIFILGLVVSTSRGAMMSVFISIILITLLNPDSKINFQKLFAFSILSILLLIMVSFSYSFILSSMNIKSKFAKQLHYRLVEEPLSIINDEGVQEFDWDNNKKQGTIRWRFFKAMRDLNVFNEQSLPKILFGFGEHGYFQIGERIFTVHDEAFQYSAHNGYVIIIVERGIVGLLLFIILYYFLISSAYRSFKLTELEFYFFPILVFFVFYSMGGHEQMIDKFAHITFGGVIGQYFVTNRLLDETVEDIEHTESQIDTNLQQSEFDD